MAFRRARNHRPRQVIACLADNSRHANAGPCAGARPLGPTGATANPTTRLCTATPPRSLWQQAIDPRFLTATGRKPSSGAAVHQSASTAMAHSSSPQPVVESLRRHDHLVPVVHPAWQSCFGASSSKWRDDVEPSWPGLHGLEHGRRHPVQVIGAGLLQRGSAISATDEHPGKSAFMRAWRPAQDQPDGPDRYYLGRPKVQTEGTGACRSPSQASKSDNESRRMALVLGQKSDLAHDSPRPLPVAGGGWPGLGGL